MIELTEVTKRYGRKGIAPDALAAVSLAVPRGAVWAVVGPNGAGKSTLLSLILGFIRPSSGTVTIAESSPREYLRGKGAGYLPERFSLPASWRVRDALSMFRRLDAVESIALDDTITLLGLEPFIDKRIGELSRGMLQRTGLAQSILAGCELIVLDEPTEGLDPVWRVRLRDIVSSLRDDLRTIIIASHDLAEVERMADRAVVLEGGRVRDIIDVRAREEPTSYRITLASSFQLIATAFPDATNSEATEHVVSVSSAAELSQRLGALIDLGGVVTAVEPVRPALEERVRDVLGDET